MAKEVSCTVCETTFTQKSGNQLYCSPECRKKDLTRNCLNCNQEFQVEKKSRRTLYCSKSCAVTVNNKEGIMGKNAKKEKPETQVKLCCHECGNEFTRIMSQVKKSQKKGTDKVFCNRTCYNKYLSRNTVQKYCKHCKEAMPLDYKSKNKIYCSRECRIKDGQVTYNCKHCGKSNTKGKASIKDVNNAFCNRECLREYALNNSSAIKEKETYTAFRNKIASVQPYKEWQQAVLEKHNHKCALCDQTQNLDVHHIIPIFKIIQRIANGEYTLENYQKVIQDPLLFNINNGIVFCEEHHELCHK